MAGLLFKEVPCPNVPPGTASEAPRRNWRWFPLTEPETVIGRDSTAGVLVPAPYVTRAEARVVREGGACYLECMNSRNATCVHGGVLRHLPRQLLSEGDEIRVGEYRFVFLDRDDDPPAGEVDAELHATSRDGGAPSHPEDFSPAWRTFPVMTLARQIFMSRDFGAMPILADALQDAGCDNTYVLDHCRGPDSHVQGCWAVDLVLGKE